MRTRWLAVLAAAGLLGPAGLDAAEDEQTTLKHTTPKGVTYIVTDEGLSEVRYQDEWVAAGEWRAAYSKHLLGEKPENAPDVGKVQQRSISVENGTARVTHHHEQITVTYRYHFSGEDVTVEARVRNTTEHELPGLTFTGLMLASKRRSDHAPKLSDELLRNRPSEAFHPSSHHPIGGGYAMGNRVGLGVAPLTRRLQRSMVYWDGAQNGGKRGLMLTHARPQTVWQRGARRFRLKLRISPDTDWKHLLAPYRATFRETFGETRYKADQRPVVEVHHESAADQIGPNNPYGYTDKKRRFDRPDNIERFTSQAVPKLRKAGVGSVIFRGLAGHDSRGLDYRPTFWLLPPKLRIYLPRLIEPMHQAGLRPGVYGRPNAWGVREDWHTSHTVPLSPDTPGHLKRMWRRLKTWRDRGAEAFFFTRFGASADDVRMLRYYREKLGPETRIYTGQTCDISLLHAIGGVRLEYDRREKQYRMALTERQRATLRWLAPDATLLAYPGERVRQRRPADEWLEHIRQKGLAPLVPDRTFEKVRASIAAWPDQPIKIQKDKKNGEGKNNNG